MKFSSIAFFSGLAALASANYVEHVTLDVTCTGDSTQTTVTETVTVTQGCNNGVVTPPPSGPGSKSITTSGGTVSSCDFVGSTTSVWVYPIPTGSTPSYDCTVAIYEDITIINVVIINISVTVINGVTSTVTSTVTDHKPTWTPQPPPNHTTTTPNNGGHNSTTSSPTSTPSTTKPVTSTTSLPVSTGTTSRPTSTPSTTKPVTSTTSLPVSTGTTSSPTSTPSTTKPVSQTSTTATTTGHSYYVEGVAQGTGKPYRFFRG